MEFASCSFPVLLPPCKNSKVFMETSILLNEILVHPEISWERTASHDAFTGNFLWRWHDLFRGQNIIYTTDILALIAEVQLGVLSHIRNCLSTQ